MLGKARKCLNRGYRWCQRFDKWSVLRKTKPLVKTLPPAEYAAAFIFCTLWTRRHYTRTFPSLLFVCATLYSTLCVDRKICCWPNRLTNKKRTGSFLLLHSWICMCVCVCACVRALTLSSIPFSVWMLCWRRWSPEHTCFPAGRRHMGIIPALVAVWSGSVHYHVFFFFLSVNGHFLALAVICHEYIIECTMCIINAQAGLLMYFTPKVKDTSRFLPMIYIGRSYSVSQTRLVLTCR